MSTPSHSHRSSLSTDQPSSAGVSSRNGRTPSPAITAGLARRTKQIIEDVTVMPVYQALAGGDDERDEPASESVAAGYRRARAG